MIDRAESTSRLLLELGAVLVREDAMGSVIKIVPNGPELGSTHTTATLEAFSEVLKCLGIDMALLIDDIDVYEMTGLASALLEDVLSRAKCISDADRILSKAEFGSR